MTTKQLWLEAPDSELDPRVVEDIRQEWDDEPTSLQVLKTIDAIIHGSTSSIFALAALQMMYYYLLEDENTTHEANEKLAAWRNQP